MSIRHGVNRNRDLDKGGDAGQDISLLRSPQEQGGWPDQRCAVVASCQEGEGFSGLGKRLKPAILEEMGHLLEMPMQIRPGERGSPAGIDTDHSPGIDPRPPSRFERASV